MVGYKYSFEAGDGGNSNEVSTQPIGDLSSKVADFASTLRSDTTATFTWTPVVGAMEIKIEQTLTGSDTWTEATTGIIAVDAATSIVTGLTASTGYDFGLVVNGGINVGNSNTLINVVTDLSKADISSSFSDTNFKQAVWEWLGNSGTPLAFSQQDLSGLMQSRRVSTCGFLAGFATEDSPCLGSKTSP
ncbi:multidomain protein with s-layer homology region, glug motif, ig motif, i-set domain [Desulfosporosinus sp. I2]|nr:multidomain protein with s-layer homology region, glug motif, ig motif, i-set domain [Desulfosporosinus sp. I2]